MAVTDVPTAKRTGMTRRERRAVLVGLLFLTPWIIHMILFELYPFIASLYYSLTVYTLLQPPIYVGLDNYVGLFFQDGLFWTSMFNTVYYMILAVGCGTIVGIVLAMLLNLKVRAMAVYRTIFYLPSVTPIVALSIVWLWLYNSQYGIINNAISAIGLPTIGWLSDPAWAKIGLVMISLWTVGGAVIIYLAGLQDIPQDLYEAAEIDGANSWNKTMNVTLPLLSPVILFNVITGMIGAFQYFTQAFIMTGGGPGDSTLMYSLYLYFNAFRYFKMGYASAMAWILFLLVMGFTLLVFRSSARWIYYGGK
jgi:multiple sugar transport system permease protein